MSGAGCAPASGPSTSLCYAQDERGAPLFRMSHLAAVVIRTLLSYRRGIKGRELIKRVSELGAARAVPVRVEAKRGKGSHITLYYGTRKTVVKDLRKEVAPGLLSGMIRQLGLTRGDFR